MDEPVDPPADADTSGVSLLLRDHDAFRAWYAPNPPVARFVCTPTVLTDVAPA